MRAVQYRTHGGSDVLAIEDVSAPQPGPGQVRVAVIASAVNPGDVFARQGAFGPAIAAREVYRPGWDFAGRIDQVGEGVDELRVGEPVIGMTNWLRDLNGTHADYVVVPADAAVRAPAHLTAQQAATLPVNASTAVQALDAMALGDGGTVVIVGAGGAVGGFALELAATRGLRGIGIGREHDRAFITARGARFAPDLAEARRLLDDDGLPGADGVFDTASLGREAISVVRDGGTYVGVIPPLAPLAERGITVTSVGVAANHDRLQLIVREAEHGRLTPRIAATFPLTRAAQAHDARAGGVRGAVLLDIANGDRS